MCAAEFIQSNKGAAKLVLNGYIYIYHKATKPSASVARRYDCKSDMHTLCTRYKDGAIDMASFLRGIGHTIRLS